MITLDALNLLLIDLITWNLVRYCECFAAGGYCDGCNCNCCRNNVENEGLRKAAKESILERNPNAFRPKIPPSPSNAQDIVVCK